jgi:hypothetical protein
MLSAIANAGKSAQIAKICPKTINSKKFKIQQKIYFLFFSKKKKKTSMCILFGFSIQEFSICPFQFQKMAVVCEF